VPSRKLLGPTYLHLIVCTLELEALIELVGDPRARQQLEGWIHYTWVYRTVLTDTERLGKVLRRHGIVCRSGNGARAAVEALDRTCRQ